MILKYFSAFIAILLFGSIADVPIMLLGVRGILSLYFVFIGGFVTDIISDLFWYWLGSKIGVERFERIKFFRQKPERMKAIDLALNKYGMLMLFCSKFIYSLGVPAQIVAGAHRYPLKKMLLANILGAGSLLVTVYSLARIFTSELVIEKYLKNADLALLLFFVVIIGIHFLISKPINKLLASKNAEKRDSSGN